MNWIGSKIVQLFRGQGAERTGFEEVYDRLVQEIDQKRKQLDAKNGTIVIWVSLFNAAEYKSARELATALTKVYRHSRIAQRAIVGEGGTIVKSLSDGIVATFPFNGTESAVKALAAAVKIQNECARINLTIPNTDDQVHTQIGITAGFVIDFNSFNPTGEKITDPQGAVVELAERLAELAKPDQILTHEMFVSALPTKPEQASLSQPIERRIRGFSDSIKIFELMWDNRPRNISFPSPIFVETGYLNADFINNQLKLARSKIVITGHTNRRFTDDFDFRNTVAEIIDRHPDFSLELVFLNPYSPFKPYSQQITRRRVEDMEKLVLENLYKGSVLFQQLASNVKFSVSDYSMIIPFTQRDEELFFALPIRSHPEGKKFIGMTGGPYFWSQIESPIAQEILRNHYQQNDKIELDIKVIISNPDSLKEILKRGKQ